VPSAVERYFDWEERTRALCEAGLRANAWIDEIYARGGECALLETASEESQELIRRMRRRREYWIGRDLEARAEAWRAELSTGIRASITADDRLGLLRHLCWLVHSTLPLTRETRDHRALIDLAAEGRAALDRVHRERATTFQIEERYQSSEGFVRRNRRKLFGNIYRIQRPDQPPRYAEVVETWQWAPQEKLTLCVPITIGCPNVCPMCEFGRYFGGDLTPREIVHLCELNLAADRDVPISTAPEDLTIYYLGGGDACLHPRVPELLELASTRWPGVQQIVSTIAVGDDALSKVVDAAAAVPRVGLQVSLCSLDARVRKICVGGVEVVPLGRAVDELVRFHRASSRKGWVSLFLVPDLYDDADQIAAEAEALLDPAAIHITLTVIRENTLPFTRKRAEPARFEIVAERLRTLGFEVSISTNDADPENEVSCGRSAISRELAGAFAKKAW
jgi:adenine C2-methylase RlmN of 23S rRNA A2503 and tRNA A37